MKLLNVVALILVLAVTGAEAFVIHDGALKRNSVVKRGQHFSKNIQR